MQTSSSASGTASSSPTILQWIVDTRPLWPEANKTKDLERVASRALSLLTPPEQASVLRYYHLRDAKLSLTSHLLKRHAIALTCKVPWDRTVPTRNERTSKPIWRDDRGRQPLSFNVSHQAGLVALIAVHGYPSHGSDASKDSSNNNNNNNTSQNATTATTSDKPTPEVEVGIDVVCTSERRPRDLQMIASQGWDYFVDMHAEVFSPKEVAHLKRGITAPKTVIPDKPGPDATAEELSDFRLRCFYALWCLREAYVKMTGEALLAPWLGNLEFRRFRPSRPASAAASAGRLPMGEGAGDEYCVREHEIYFMGESVVDANVCLKSFGPDYMVCVAVRTPGRKEDGLGFPLGAFDLISMDAIVESSAAHLTSEA